MMEFQFDKVEEIIGYKFKNKNLLKIAFTHSSYSNENNVESNERLEFLGDSILNFIVAENLYSEFDVEEGKMSKWRSQMVGTENLSSIADTLGFDKFLLVGNGLFGQELSSSVKENLFESIVASIYLDGGLKNAKEFVFKFIDIEKVTQEQDVNYKSRLQERVQEVKGANLVYVTYEDPKLPGSFCAEIYINDIFVARNRASSKKRAQMGCAKIILDDEETLKTILSIPME